MHSNLSTTVSSSIGKKIEDGLVASLALSEMSPGYEHFTRIFTSDIRVCYELLEKLYLRSDDELSESAEYEVLYARTLSWFNDSLREVVSRGYNLEIFFCGAFSIGRAIAEGDEVTEAEHSSFREACEVVTESIWQHFIEEDKEWEEYDNQV